MKKLIVLSILIALVLIAIVSCTKKTEKIIIGSTVPLTGEASTWGNYTKMGAELAVAEYNENKEADDPKIEIIFEDTKSVAKEGITALNKLINFNHVQAVVDDAVSSIALAIAPIADEKEVVLISTGATNPKLSDAGPFYFRVWNSDFEEGLFSAKFCFENMKFRRIAVLSIQNDYGEGLSEVFKERFEQMGGVIAISEKYEQGASQFRNLLSKIKNSKADALYLVSYPEETPQILLQMQNYKLDIPLIGTVPMQDESIIAKAGAAAEGVIYPYPVDPEGEIVDEFEMKYKEKFNESPGTTSAEGYDAARLIIEAIKSSGNDGKLIRDYLNNLVEWKGASGIIEFDENGDVHKPMVMKTIKNGEFVEISK